MIKTHVVTPESVAKHVQGLLGIAVSMKKLGTQLLKVPLVVSSIVDEADAESCVIVAEIAAAGSLGAALSRIPAGAVQDMLRRGQLLDEDLLGNYHEVVNVLTVLTTLALGRRTLLRSVHQSTEALDVASSERLARADLALFLQVGVQGYPAGGMNLYLLER